MVGVFKPRLNRLYGFHNKPVANMLSATPVNMPFNPQMEPSQKEHPRFITPSTTGDQTSPKS